MIHRLRKDTVWESPTMPECGPSYCMPTQNGWDIFAGASFIYWNPYQENYAPRTYTKIGVCQF